MPTLKTLFTLRLLVVAVLFALAFGCSPAPDTAAQYGNEADDTALLTPQELADRKLALSRKWQDAQDRLEELRAKANADGIQNEWDQTVAKLDREAADLGRELDQFGEDSRLTWNKFESKVDRGLDAISREIDEAVASFN